MCAHYESVKDVTKLQEVFGVGLPAGAVHDVWPGGVAPFIRRPRMPDGQAAAAGAREAMAGRFGLIPHWARDATLGRKTYNARRETVADKPSYRDAWRLGRRCIIPADALYEPDWRSGRAVPARIVRADGRPLGIAGIWTGWKAPDGQIVRSMSMLTVNADHHPLMRQFHRPEDEKRMVVVLEEDAFDAWLTESVAQAWALMDRSLDVDLTVSTGMPPAIGPDEGNARR